MAYNSDPGYDPSAAVILQQLKIFPLFTTTHHHSIFLSLSPLSSGNGVRIKIDVARPTTLNSGSSDDGAPLPLPLPCSLPRRG